MAFESLGAIRDALINNPFFVLDIAPTATRQEIERQGTKLLGMLKLGLAAAKHYTSPLGSHERTEDAVRTAMATLREPKSRLLAELWARHASTVVAPQSNPANAAANDGIPNARERLGWGTRKQVRSTKEPT